MRQRDITWANIGPQFMHPCSRNICTVLHANQGSYVKDSTENLLGPVTIPV